MGDKHFKSSILKIGVFLVLLATLLFSGPVPARAGFFDQAGSYLSDGGKTFGNAAGHFGNGALNIWQKVGDGLGGAAGVVVKNASQASGAFLGGVKSFGQTVGGLGNQVTKEYDAALGKVKQGTDKAVDAVVNVLPKKNVVKIAAPKPAIKKENATTPPTVTEAPALPLAPVVVQKEENEKQPAPVVPKEIIIYSNKANQKSVQPLVATAAKASTASGNSVFETIKSKGNVFVGDDVVIDAATGIATLKGIKIIGTVDFTGADVKGFKQTVVNNYSGGSTPLVVYNSSSGNYETRSSISGNYGGVSEQFSIGTDLTVGKNATVASAFTIGSTSANGSLTVNGAAAITGATTLSGAATLSSDLTVNGNTTLGDVAGDTITINGRLSTLNISDGSTTSSLAKNSFYIAADSSNALGKFYVDLSGNVSASGTITSSGGITMSGHLAPSSDNLYDVGSSSTQWRYGNFQGGLLVADGSTTSTLLNNSLTLGQSANYSSGFFYINSSGNTFASGTLQVTNTSTLYNDLLVGASTESIADAGFVFTGNDLYVEDQFGVNGNAWFDGSIRASSTLLIGTAAGTDNLFVSGNNTYIATSTAYGTAYSLVIGNGTTGALVAGGHAVPSHGSLFNLGNDSLRWNNIYSNTDNVSTTLYVGTGGTTLSTLSANSLAFAGSLGVVSSTAGNLRLAADGANQLQLWTGGLQRAFIDSSGNTFASGTLQVTNTSTLYNDLLVGASTESIADAGFVFTGNDLYVHDQLGVNGNAWFDGSIRASSTLLIGTAAGTDNFFVNGNNTYVATSTAYGTAYSLVIGNGTTGALVAGGHAVPSHGSLFNLGNDSLRWNNIYSNTDNVSTTLYVGTGGTTLSTLTANNLAFAGSLGVVSSTAGNLRLAADGANQLQLWTGGLQRAFIDSSGNTFASGTLQVTNTSTLYNDLLIGASTESIADAGFVFTGNDLYVHDQLGVNGNAWFDGSIRASSTLLIGTAAGTDNFFANGNNTYVATSTAYGTAYSLVIGNGTTGALVAGGHAIPSHSALFNLGSDSLRWSNIYSNTDNVSTTLYVGTGGTTLSTLTANNLAFAGSLGVVSSTAGNLRLAADGTNQLQLWTNDSNRVTINSSGYVGIASSTPSSILAVGQTGDTNIVRLTGDVRFGEWSTGGYTYIRADDGAANAIGLFFRTQPAAGGITDAFRLDSDGKAAFLAGSNFTPSYSVEMNSDLRLRGGSRTLYVTDSGGSASASSSLGIDSLIIGSNITTYKQGVFGVDSSGNTSVSGTTRIFGGASTGGFKVTAVNTTTTLTSSATSTTGVGAGAFVLDTDTAYPTTLPGQNILLSVRNNGTKMFSIDGGGQVKAAGTVNASSPNPGDVAEFINLVSGEEVEAGDVIVVDLAGLNQYRKSTSAYASNVAGVISDTGRFVIGESGPGKAALALAGLVKVKVSDENGPISAGDYLVSASQPGFAMKYDSASGKAAGLVGMALEPLANGEGKIMILVNKGFVSGSGNTASLTVGENGDGSLSGGADWDLGGKNILNVKAISSANGLWYINESGSLMAKEIKADKVQAKKFVVEKENDLKKASVGQATISNNNSSIVVENELVTAKTKIFITFRSNPSSFWWIAKQEDGKFEVALSKVAEGDLTFDYWIVGIEEAPTTEPEAAPAAAIAPVEPPVAPAPVVVPAVSPAISTPEPEVAPAVEETPVAPVAPVEPSAPETPASSPAAESAPAEAAPIVSEIPNP